MPMPLPSVGCYRVFGHLGLSDRTPRASNPAPAGFHAPSSTDAWTWGGRVYYLEPKAWAALGRVLDLTRAAGAAGDSRKRFEMIEQDLWARLAIPVRMLICPFDCS